MLCVNSTKEDSEEKWAKKLYKYFTTIKTLESQQAGDEPQFADVLMPVAESFALKYELKMQIQETVNTEVARVDVESI